MKTLQALLARRVVSIFNRVAILLGNRFYRFFLEQIAYKHSLLNKSEPDKKPVLAKKYLPKPVFIDGREVHFTCPNSLTRWRINTFFTKEPATLAWIDKFTSGAVMWDVGANIGIYSLYAALSRGATVLAFEPAFTNYAALCENVGLNKLNKQISVFPVALSDECILGKIFMSNTKDAGASSSSFGNDFVEDVPTLSLLGYSIDGFIDAFNPPFPEHIKIDVDGIEEKILIGAKRTLRDSRLRSICIEGDAAQLGQVDRIKAMITECGFQLVHSCSSPLYPESKSQNLYFARFEAL